MVYDQGKCSALLTKEGFFDFRVFKTQCNVRHSVAVVCQHDMTSNRVFSNNMSDIKLSLVDGFQSIQIFSSCDPGWFMVDDVCINFYHCPGCMNNYKAHEHCFMHGGQLAYHLLNNVTFSTPGNKLDKNTKLSLFWDMFCHMEDISPSIRNTFDFHFNNQFHIGDTLKRHFLYFAVNDSALCVSLSSECKEGDIVLSVGYHNQILKIYMWGTGVSYRQDGYLLYKNGQKDPNYLWSFIHQPTFEINNHKHLTFCEKSVVHAAALTNCSEFYMRCHEGTCIHDSLVCDGHSHCPHGEDEADCQHICSDHSDNCISHCYHRDLCFCSLEYFQCLSGCCVLYRNCVTKLSTAMMHLTSHQHVYI